MTTAAPEEPAPVLVLNGGYGVGKSTVLDHVGDALARQGRPFSLFDVDWFHRNWPVRADDPDNVRVEALNLDAVWRNYRACGPRQPVLSGVVVDAAARTRYSEAFGLPVWSALLTGRVDVVEQRLRGRYSGAQRQARDWHLERVVPLQDALLAAGLDQVVIDTSDLTPDEVAGRVLAAFDARERGPL